MLKKSLRLKSKEDFDRVFRFGKVISFQGIACRFVENPRGNFRLGFSLSKKHLPLSVDRNRFRRVVAALVSEKKEQWPKALDVIFSLQRTPHLLGKKDCAPALDYFLRETTRICKK